MFLFIVLLLFIRSTIWWKREGRDLSRSNFNRNERTISPKNVMNLGVKWSLHVGCTVNRQVLVYDKFAYYGGYCGTFRALDRETGEVIWGASIETTHTGTAYHDGVVYVGGRCMYDNCGTLYAYEYDTGKQLWSHHNSKERIAIAVMSEKTVYVTDEESTFHAIDMSTGNVSWSSSPGCYGVVFDKKSKTVIVSGGPVSKGVRALDEKDGKLAWSGGMDMVFSSPILTEKYTIVHTEGYILAYDTQKCFEHGVNCEYSWRGIVKKPQKNLSPPSFDDFYVYLGVVDTLYAFPKDCKSEECKSVWETKLDCSFFGPPPAIANGIVFVACDSGYLYALSAENGKILWSYSTPGGYELRSTPTIVDGILYHVATFDFQIFAFNTTK